MSNTYRIYQDNRLKTFFVTLSVLLFVFPAVRPSIAQLLPANRSENILRSETLNNEAVQKSDAGKFTEAIELFQQAIDLWPDNFIAYGNLGGTFYRAGRLEEAVSALKKAVDLNPNFAKTYSKLGTVYADLGKTDEAIKSLNQAVKLQPNFAIAHYNLGCVYIRQQRFKQAVSQLERAAQLNPNHAETFVQLGYALSRLKKYGGAIKEIEQAVRLRPTDAEAQFFLGQLYLLNRDRSSALGQYRKIRSLDSQLADKLYTTIYSHLLVKVGETILKK